MNYEWRGAEVVLLPGDYELAYWHAIEAMKEHTDTPHNRFWTPVELAVHGYLAEVGFQRYLGIAPCVSVDPARAAPDVGQCQVKSMAWHSAKTMDDWEGGNVFVPTYRQAPVIVAVSMFAATLRDRVFYEGWLPAELVRRFRIARGYRPAHAVPYMNLNPPAVPLPASACDASARAVLVRERARRIRSVLYPPYTDPEESHDAAT